MYAREQAKQEVVNALKKYLEVDISIDDIETPPNPLMGDFAYPVFQSANTKRSIYQPRRDRLRRVLEGISYRGHFIVNTFAFPFH